MPRRPTSHQPVPAVTAASLLADLDSGGGVVTVPDPPDAVRAAYRKAINRAITDRLVPQGRSLRHSGRDRGDLVIRLVSVEGATWPDPQEPIPVPEALDDHHQGLEAFRDKAGLLDVSDETRPRALRIVQAISDECSRRGYGFGTRDDHEPSFQIAIVDDQFMFTLSEEFDRREVLDSEKLASARYSWQRIPSSVQPVRSGRLVLRMGSGYGSLSWADRTRWTLDQKLPQMFREIADRAGAEAEKRRLRDEKRKKRRQEWEDALPLAKQAYIDHLNRNRLRDQVARSTEAEAVRVYCGRLDRMAEQCGDSEVAAQVADWAMWARREADRIDPLGSADQLAYFTPTEVSPTDMDKFMPKGLYAWTPPD